RAGHRQHPCPGRAADRAHQSSHRAPARAEERPSLASWSADARRASSAVPGLSAPPRPRGLPRAHQRAGPQKVTVVGPGAPAPSFRLQREDGERVTEQDLRGKTTILVFYPFAFSPVCTDQFQVYEKSLAELTANGETMYGVSCDSSYAQTAFREKLGVSIAQLSDFEPKGAACSAFGVLHEGGVPQRALVIAGPDGVVRWSYQAPSPAELPGVELLREGLAAAASSV